MWGLFDNILFSEQFIPHGHCYLWQPSLVWLHGASDALIALAYYSISVWLLYFIHQRRDVPFPGIFLLFGTFISACGTTHILEVWTLWHPIYWVSGTVKALTATVSLFAALEMGPLLPTVLALSSPTQLQVTNQELEQQILERQQAELALQTTHNQLEIRVAERTTALAQANKELRLEIVERQRIEVTLRESEQRFRATFELAAVGIAHIGLDGQWLRVNQKLCDIVGYTRSELFNLTFQDITHPEDLASDLEYVHQILAGAISTYSMEKRYIRKDGSAIWVNLTVSLVQEAGQPKYFISVIEDISERLQAKEAIRKQAEQAQLLAELQKLNQLKDDFLSTVSHELRTPMSNMKMALQMLTIATTPERQQRYLEILKAECAREIDLINDLLDLQRLEAAAYPTFLVESINLQDWFPSLILPFHSRIQEHQQVIKIQLPEDLPPLITDRASLERLLGELLNNACKYTPAGGEIILSAQAMNSLPSEHTALSVPLTCLMIQNQAEIPPTELPRIFNKFYRVPHADPWKQGGTGLGLALVKRLVEQLQGNIQADSRQGWTSFTIQLPPLNLVPNSQLTANSLRDDNL
jgi:PAS domain S-box-containing protein